MRSKFCAASVRRIREHYGAWRWLFPYFEKLPALGAEEFAALARFESSVAGRRPEELNEIAGEWHSLVKLAELGVTSGALDGAEGARAFRRACQAASAPDHREQALAAVREMLGDPDDLDEAIPGRLLRLSGDRRAAFDRVLELQRIPRVAGASRSPEKTLAALAGLVYAATLRPDSLLVAENPELAAAHRFVEAPSQCGPFCPALPTVESGRAYVAGGFAGFERAVQFIGREKIQPAAVTDARGAARKEDSPAADFQASARLVEVYVSSPGEHSASKGDFKILDNGKPAAIGHFENDSAAVSVALLLDASNSMTPAMASLRKSACALASNLRPIDSSAVFGFGETMTELQTWTHEADAAKRAVLSLRTHGATELYDALVRLIYEMAGRTGKKAIVVFTDGDDTASGLSSDQAVRRAKEKGIPIYTVAHGAALTRRLFVERLAAMAKATGGLSFAIREPREIGPVFERISQDLSHGYLLSFSPDEDPGGAWHTLQVTMRGKAVRAREGYYPE
jgi:VWFA-related protein